MQPDFPVRDPETHAVIGAAFEVNRVLGRGFLEQVKATRFERGLILNFGGRSLEWKRLVFSEALHQPQDQRGDT